VTIKYVYLTLGAGFYILSFIVSRIRNIIQNW